LATDGSADAERAVELVASSFDPTEIGTIEVLAVVPRVAEPLGHGADEPPITLIEGEWQRAAQEVVERTSARLAEAGHARVGMVRWGHPAETIVTRAGEVGTSLVALGTRGLSGWKRRRTGSVSGKVARYASVSVLVARSGGPVRRVLLGYDASPDADVALTQVATLPWRESIEVTVCTSYEVPPPALSGATPALVADLQAAHSDVSRWAREAAEVMASDAEQRLREQGISAVARVARGVAHEQLAVIAAEMPADLLVVGSRGLSAIQRFFLGSTSATLLAHPPTSVLVARSGGDVA
jgi:nucleotide-binding universal stress UspA family protein